MIFEEFDAEKIQDFECTEEENVSFAIDNDEKAEWAIEKLKGLKDEYERIQNRWCNFKRAIAVVVGVDSLRLANSRPACQSFEDISGDFKRFKRLYLLFFCVLVIQSDVKRVFGHGVFLLYINIVFLGVC